MTYNKFIENIISTRGQWNIPEGDYYEIHHILPRCMGGEPQKYTRNTIHKNLIWLTPEEHFIAHKLLLEENKDNIELQYAFNMMSNFNKINSKEYSDLRSGWHHSEETKEKIGKANRGRKMSKEFCEAISKRRTGVKLGPMKEETKKKLSENRLGKDNPMYGKHHSLESREKISKGNTGKIVSEETKRKISAANTGEKNGMYGKFGALHHNYGKKASEETIKKLHESHLGQIPGNAMSVLCIETGEVYQSKTEAERKTNISRYKISKSISTGKVDINGNHWKMI